MNQPNLTYYSASGLRGEDILKHGQAASVASVGYSHWMAGLVLHSASKLLALMVGMNQAPADEDATRSLRRVSKSYLECERPTSREEDCGIGGMDLANPTWMLGTLHGWDGSPNS